MSAIPPAERNRARSLEELDKINAQLFDGSQFAKALTDYEVDPSDVIITPYAKCGTTWVQQIFHTLRTRGDMDFDDISRVVPWIETAPMLGLDINAPQRAAPAASRATWAMTTSPRALATSM